MQSITQLPADDGFRDFVKHIKFVHPVDGLTAYEPYDYLYRLKNEIENNRFVIGKKFRQGGYSTFMCVYFLWKGYQGDTCLYMTKTDREACYTSKMLRCFLQQLIESGVIHNNSVVKSNDHEVRFSNGGLINFYTPEPSRGSSYKWAYIDEAAFYRSFQNYWPVLSPIFCNGHLLVMSTPNGNDGWFFETYLEAQNGKNDFLVHENHFLECPLYTGDFVKRTRENLGERGFRQEVLAEFLVHEDPQAARKALLHLIDNLKPQQVQKLIDFIKQITG